MRCAAAAAALFVLGSATPAYASASTAAAIEVVALASATVQVSPEQGASGCAVRVVVESTAFITPGARVMDVTVEWEGGGPAGKHDQHRFASSVDTDSVTFTFDVAGFKPGDYKAVVRWQVHNGNGFSMASAAVRTMAMEIRPDPSIVKLGTETKCQMEKELTKYVNRAINLREHADQIREGCPKCAAYVESVAAGDDSMAEIAASMALDPPDPAFTTLPTALAPAVPDTPAVAGVGAPVATAFHDLLAAQAEAYGQARAALSAIEKAQGAHLANDTTWESRQSLAAAGFLTALATQLERAATASQALGAQMAAAGFPNPTADQPGAVKLAAAIRKNGLPPVPGFPNWYKDQAGLTDAQLEGIAVRYVLAAPQFGNPMTLRDILNDAAFKNTMGATADALRANASALTAQPLLNYAEQSGSPSPSPSPSATARATQASPVVNGGFDAKALPAGWQYQTLTAGKETLDGWRIERGSIDVVGAGGGRAATGQQFVDLSGNNTQAGMGVIAQDVAVTAGHTYRLSFQLSGNPNGTPQVKTIKVTFGDKEQTFTFDTKGHNNNDLGWTTYTMEFASCGTSKLTVRFASQTEGSRGPNLDDIVVTDLGGATCLPFPLWLIWLVAGLLLAALAVFLYLRWRRRNGSATAEGPAAEPDAAEPASAEPTSAEPTSAEPTAAEPAAGEVPPAG